MGKRVVETPYCDAPDCGVEDGVETLEMKVGGREYEPDFCGKHREQLEHLLSEVRPKRKRRRGLHPINPEDIPRLN